MNSYDEERIKNIIFETLKGKKEIVSLENGRLRIVNYEDIDYPVVCEIKLERIN